MDKFKRTRMCAEKPGQNCLLRFSPQGNSVKFRCDKDVATNTNSTGFPGLRFFRFCTR